MATVKWITSVIAAAAAIVGFAVPAGAALAGEFNDCTTAVAETCLLVTFETGGDDLRGGGLGLTVRVDVRARGGEARGPRSVGNVNLGASWGSNTSHTIGINLRKLYGVDIPAGDINSIALEPDLRAYGPFEGTDNWNLQAVTVRHRVFGAAPTTLTQASALTPYRFTINNATAYVRIDDLLDGGFEWTQSPPLVVPPWFTEGPDSKGLDIGRGLANTGANNAWIRTSSRNWNAILQTIPVDPNRNYVLRGFVRTSGHGNGADVNTAFFGVRMSGIWPPVEQHFGPSPAGNYQEIVQPFNPGNRTSVTVFCGFWGMGTDGWMQIDSLSVFPS